MKTKLGILWIFFQVITHFAFGQQYQTKIYFEITEDVINNIIEAQSIPRSFSGTYDGINYGAAANVQIKLKANQISARLVVSGSLSHPNGNSEEIIWAVNPSVTINSFDITATEVIGVLESIPSLINSQSGPQFLKDIIINAYEDLELTLYPQKLLDEANELVPTFLDIEVTDIGFGWTILDKKIRFNATVYSTVEPPVFGIVGDRDQGIIGFKFSSSVETQINEVAVYTIGGSLVWSNTNLSNSESYHIIKGGSTEWKWKCYCAAGNYVVRVLFDSPFQLVLNQNPQQQKIDQCNHHY